MAMVVMNGKVYSIEISIRRTFISKEINYFINLLFLRMEQDWLFNQFSFFHIFFTSQTDKELTIKKYIFIFYRFSHDTLLL